MRRLISVVLVGALLACGGGEKTTGPGEALTASFTLRTLNSSTLPAILLQDPTGQLEVLSGNLNFNDDRSWNGAVAVRFTSIGGGATTQTVTRNGTYQLNGSTIVVRDNTTSSNYDGTLNGNTLSVSMQLIPGVVTQTVWQK
jgi:hypothetical protein